MGPEFAGACAAWLAHSLLYVSSERPRVGLTAALPRAPRRIARAAALALFILSALAWTRAHELALGVCCALATWMAAASVNAIVAPLSPRGFWLFAAAALLSVLLTLGGLRGA